MILGVSLALLSICIGAVYIRRIFIGLRTNVATLRGVSVDRSEFPGIFWFYIVAMAFAVIACSALPAFVALTMLFPGCSRYEFINKVLVC
jgi:hypothetical protein